MRHPMLVRCSYFNKHSPVINDTFIMHQYWLFAHIIRMEIFNFKIKYFNRRIKFFILCGSNCDRRAIGKL